jgi:hypothetical protein
MQPCELCWEFGVEVEPARRSHQNAQQLWEKELFSYKTYPPLQALETYNLDGILKAVQAGSEHPSQ